MNPAEIIAKKRDGGELTADEINYFISEFTKGVIPEYQMSAFLMAVYFKSMTPRETSALTMAMLDSGEKVVFDPGDKTLIDKHSSGGIGDKVSMILAPLMASCGLKIPMLSGRGLGHTGGTLDKLESIPGFRTDLSIEEFKQGVMDIGCIITGQTPEIAPADRMMYALRDVTGTVESIPLICGSILSKKFAGGPNSIVFDIKCGGGAFMKSVDDAKDLGRNLCDICKAIGKGSAYLITDMNQPLGLAAGNALEIDECVTALKGAGPDDLMEVVFGLGESMLNLGGIAWGGDASELQLKMIGDGSALVKFLEMIRFQGGETGKLEKGESLLPAKKILEIKSTEPGYIGTIDAYRLGRLIIEMGGGRRVVGQAIDHSVGVIVRKKIGDTVEANDILVEAHSSGNPDDAYLKAEFGKCFTISKTSVKPPDMIISKYE